MWRKTSSHVVRPPDIHLRAASAIVTNSRDGLGVPIPGVRLPPDELYIMRALCVAIPGAILGAGRVPLPIVIASSVHLHEVQRAFEATTQIARVYVDGELAILQLEHLVSILAIHDEDAGPGVRVPVSGFECQLHTVIRVIRLDAMGLVVVRTLDAARLRTCRGIGASHWIPRVVIPVAALAILANPPQIGINHHKAHFVLAAARCTIRLHAHPRVNLRSRRSRLLANRDADRGHGEHGTQRRGPSAHSCRDAERAH
mmetsp:Transcript_5150/g.15221  ORF Transcript_5150/g.15221 Transcript_5150/m.15221 type:complete len:257 (+) Transcript_5150:799-1569(+)